MRKRKKQFIYSFWAKENKIKTFPFEIFKHEEVNSIGSTNFPHTSHMPK